MSGATTCISVRVEVRRPVDHPMWVWGTASVKRAVRQVFECHYCQRSCRDSFNLVVHEMACQRRHKFCHSCKYCGHKFLNA